METQAHIMSAMRIGAGSRVVVVCVRAMGARRPVRQAPRPRRHPRPSRRRQPAPGAMPAGAREYKVVAGGIAAADPRVSRRRHGAPRAQPRDRVAPARRARCTSPTIRSATRFDISFPVNELTVDEPALREAAGPDFPPGVPQSARDGTRANLLSRGAARRRELSVDPAARHRRAAPPASGLRRRRRSHPQGRRPTSLRVPVSVERSDGAIVASGEFPLKQSELGLKPFSVGHGRAAWCSTRCRSASR